MAYKIMKNLIAQGNKTKEELLNMVDVYYAAGRLTGEQYTEIVGLIGTEDETDTDDNQAGTDKRGEEN